MPELPDVEGFRRHVARHALGRPVQRVEVPDRDLLRNRSNRRGRIPPDPGWLTGVRDERAAECPRGDTGPAERLCPFSRDFGPRRVVSSGEAGMEEHPKEVGMMLADCEVDRRGDAALVALHGELSGDSVARVRRRLRRNSDLLGATRIVFDLRGIGDIDEGGIDLLLDEVARAQRGGVDIAIVRPDGAVQHAAHV